MVRPQYARREQRKYQRYALHPRMTFSIDGGPLIYARCRDISLGGAFVETSTIPLFASSIHVVLDLDSREVSVLAIVRWTGPNGIGIQFGALSARDTHALVAYFQSSKAGPKD